MVAAIWTPDFGAVVAPCVPLTPGYLADFLLLDGLENCEIHSVIRQGRRAGTSTPRLQSAEGGVSRPNPFVM